MVRKRILLVEDSELNHDLLTQILEDEYDVRVASDGEEGVRKAVAERPDLVLMDLALPLLDDWWEATRQIKSTEGLRQIPVIAITSHAMVGEERRAREAGGDDYLSKPIDERLLVDKIGRWVKS